MSRPGQPMSRVPPLPEVLIQEMGDYRNDDGAQMLIHGDQLVFQAKASGMEMYLAVDICDVLEAIQKVTKMSGN